MTSEIFKTLTSAKAIAFLFVAWGLPIAFASLIWLLVEQDDWQAILPAEFTAALTSIGLSGPWLFFVVWAGLTLAFGLNSRSFFRIFEGYPFPDFLKRRRGRIHWLRREQARIADRLESIRGRSAANLPSGTPSPQDLSNQLLQTETDLKAALGRVGRIVGRAPWRLQSNWRDMPTTLDQTMPTVFGGRIRAFERYGNVRWGLDILVLWYEFVDVADERASDAIDSARQGVEIAIGASVSALALALTSAFPLMWRSTWDSGPLDLIVVLLGAVVVAYFSYRKAVEATSEWAASVRALVNNHRGDVAAAFGFKLPDTLAEEQKFWKALTAFVRTGGDGWSVILDRYERTEKK